jgi:hypothetical protein
MEKQSDRLAQEFLQQEARQQQEAMDALNRRWLPQWFPPNTPAQPMGTASWWQDLLDQRQEEARAGSQTAVAKVWRAIAQHDEAFQYGKTTRKSAADIAAAVSLPGKLVTARDSGDTVRFMGPNGHLDIHEADTARPYIRSTEASSQGKKGGGGTQLYQAALDWMHNNGKRITDDSSLTSINAIRRTSNFASSALIENASSSPSLPLIPKHLESAWQRWKEQSSHDPRLKHFSPGGLMSLFLRLEFEKTHPND